MNGQSLTKVSPEFLESMVDRELAKQEKLRRPSWYESVDDRGTVVAIVDGIVYYNSKPHRKREQP